MNLPPHPDSSDANAHGIPRRGPDRNRSTATTILLWVVAAIVLLVIILHLTGVVGPLSK